MIIMRSFDCSKKVSLHITLVVSFKRFNRTVQEETGQVDREMSIVRVQATISPQTNEEKEKRTVSFATILNKARKLG